jgi:glycine oxidase
MTVDVLIVGQGLAGTTLAWHLLRAGVTILIIDQGLQNTSSLIAAGLLTPITGQRLAKSWRLDDLWPVAEKFYQDLELELGVSFYQHTKMVRIFLNDEERRTYQERADNTFAGWVTDPSPPLNPEWFDAPRGAFEMPRTAQLHTRTFLMSSQEAFKKRGVYRQTLIEHQTDINTNNELIELDSHNIAAKRIVFCEGASAVQNEFFKFVRFQPAKGEILTVKIPGLREDRIIHQGVWLVPIGQECFRVGSTFHRDRLDSEPSQAGREEILGKLRSFVRLPVEVLAHDAAVRPVIDAGRPLLGTHPDDDRLGFFNGFGAKGALIAPYFAAQLANHLTGRGRIDAEVRIGLPVVHPSIGPRLTEQAQLAIRSVLRPGEVAIDATAGNGRDTKFLAETVGDNGFVYGFDLQQTALDRTAEQLQAAGLSHVKLVCRDHAEMLMEIAPSHVGKISAAMFNLGYLPGGDKEFITNPEKSVPAVRAACELLRPSGICTVVAYVGHPGGAEEFDAVRSCLRDLPPLRFDVQEPPDRGPANAPRLFIIRKRTA